MTDTHAIDAVAELTRPGGALDLGRDQARLLGRMLRLLAQGHPLTGMDTLIFAHVLQTTIGIESTAPTGEIVRLTAGPTGVTGVDPATAVVTERVPAGEQIDFSTKTAIWGSFCHHNLFFPDRAQAEQWAAGRDDIAIMSIEDGFTAARHMAEALSRYDSEESR